LTTDLFDCSSTPSLANSRPRILTTHPKGFHPLWTAQTVLLPGWLDEANRTQGRPISLFRSLYWGWKLFRTSRNFDVVVTAFERSWHVFTLMNSLLRRDKRRHIFVFVNLTLPTGVRSPWLKRWYYRQIIMAAERTVVFSRRQVEMYAHALGAPAGKFVCVPYHSTIGNDSTNGGTPKYRLSEGDYIFAGGDSNRDYGPLIEAVRHLPHRVVIAARSSNHFRSLKIPANVEILTVDPEDFFRLMAGAKVVVVPVRGGLLQGGQQTYLNAMAMGKPVVVADDTGADEYIIQGHTGLVVPPGDPIGLRRALLSVLGNDEFGRALGRAAKNAAPRYSLDRFIEGVMSIICDVDSKTKASTSLTRFDSRI
jgi:glycosyltransferase involved in cell wall biosynthesis